MRRRQRVSRAPCRHACAAAGTGWCCWTHAAPLVCHGVAFRTALRGGGERGASEAMLLCSDYAALGYGRVVMDPGLPLEYEPHTARTAVGGVGLVPAPLVPSAGVAAAAGDALWEDATAARGSDAVDMECCDPAPGHLVSGRHW
jgi:hypothetical protein